MWAMANLGHGKRWLTMIYRPQVHLSTGRTRLSASPVILRFAEGQGDHAWDPNFGKGSDTADS